MRLYNIIVKNQAYAKKYLYKIYAPHPVDYRRELAFVRHVQPALAGKERRKVDGNYAAAVLGGNFYRGVVGDYEFAPVARNVVVYPGGYCIKQRALAGIAAAGDYGHAFFYAHWL